jgi:hypothetical protein
MRWLRSISALFYACLVVSASRKARQSPKLTAEPTENQRKQETSVDKVAPNQSQQATRSKFNEA